MNYERHHLSAIFGDIPADEFNALQADIDKNGFTDHVIITYEGKILDGWHRYKIAKKVDRLEELVFKPLAILKPSEYVMSKNLHRRHLTESQRAQIVVEAHGWETGGGDRKSEKYKTTSQSCEVIKTREEMAEEANVSPRTIDTAKQVSRAGRSDEVIAGEKSAPAVVKEEKEKLEFTLPQPEPEPTQTSLLDPQITTTQPPPISEPTEEPEVIDPKQAMKIVFDPDFITRDNAFSLASSKWTEMPDMSPENWQALRRNFLRHIHPDKIDMTEWNNTEQQSWTVLFQFINDFLSLIETDYREQAILKKD